MQTSVLVAAKCGPPGLGFFAVCDMVIAPEADAVPTPNADAQLDALAQVYTGEDDPPADDAQTSEAREIEAMVKPAEDDDRPFVPLEYHFGNMRFHDKGRRAYRDCPRIAERLTNDGKCLWLDLELTGLDYENDVIIEIACLAANGDVRALDDGLELVVRTDKAVLDAMGPWCQKQHGKTGLITACLEAELGMTQVEDRVIEYVSKHFPEGGALLAGSSVHVDKHWLRKDVRCRSFGCPDTAQMPRLHALLTHRVLDVSVVRELCMRWYPLVRERQDRKSSDHRAMGDVKQSMADLRYFKRTLFLPQQPKPIVLETGNAVFGWD